MARQHSTDILIRNGKILRSGKRVTGADLLIQSGIVTSIKRRIEPSTKYKVKVIDAKGKIVCPGFIDLHVHLREPGFEYKETIQSPLDGMNLVKIMY